MPSTTTRLALPYPVPADTVDVPRDVQALANALDAIQGISASAVTSLPGTPYDGQEVYYVVNAAAGMIWHLRYRAASPNTSKWEFVGGSSLIGFATAAASLTTAGTGTFTDMTNGPTLTVPLVGAYLASWYGSAAQNAATTLAEARVGLFNQANTQVGGNAQIVTNAQFMAQSPYRQDIVSLAAGDVLKLRIATNNIAFNFSAVGFWALQLVPFRVG